MSDLYRFWPAVIQRQDLLASGFPNALNPYVGLTAPGATVGQLGESAVYRYFEVGHPLDDWVVYWIRWRVHDGSEWSEWTNDKFRPDSGDREIRFPISDLADEPTGPYNFDLEVYANRQRSVLVFSADSLDSTVGWYVRQEAILQKLTEALLERDAAINEELVENLGDLHDIDLMDGQQRLLMSINLGTFLDQEAADDFQRFFIKQLVSFYKTKGTIHSWRVAQLWAVDMVNKFRELYKQVPNEDCDYSAVKDLDHQLRAARFDFEGVCGSSCETGVEIPALEIREAKKLLPLIEPVRPIHVILRIPCVIDTASDLLPTISDTIAGSRIYGIFRDQIPSIQDELVVVRTCQGAAQVDCQTCCETQCTSCEAFNCEASSVQLPTGCQFSCTLSPELYPNFGGGGGGGCTLQYQVCDLTKEGPGGGCGNSTRPAGGLKCQSFNQVPPPPGGGPFYMAVVVQDDPEFGAATVAEWRTPEQVVTDITDSGYTVVRGETIGFPELTESFGEGGEPQGTVFTSTGEPCNRCPSSQDADLTTAQAAYTSTQGQALPGPPAGGPQ